MQRIAEYEIRDCGVDHAQYFQGVGTSFTKWEHVALGAGNNAKEAYEDAVEQLACDGTWDVARLPKHPRGFRKSDTVRKAVGPCDVCGARGYCEHDDGEMHWYVAIYVR